jgi:hypothetical protein
MVYRCIRESGESISVKFMVQCQISFFSSCEGDISSRLRAGRRNKDVRLQV